MLLEFDPDMEMAIMVEEEFFPVCDVESDIVEMTDEETGEKQEIFVLAPCLGHHEIEELPISNPNLN